MEQNKTKMSQEENTRSVHVDDFDINNFIVDNLEKIKLPQDEEKKKMLQNSKQHTIFPKYLYPGENGDEGAKANNGDVLRIFTDEIDFNNNGHQYLGIPMFNEKFMMSGSKKDVTKICNFTVPLGWNGPQKDIPQLGGEGAVKLRKILQQIDDKMTNAIRDGKPSWLSSQIGSGEKKPILELAYNAIVKSPGPPEDPIKAAEFKPWFNCNIKIAHDKKVADPDIENPITSILIQVFNPKTKKMDIYNPTSIDEVKKYFAAGCKAHLVIEISTFYALKNKGAPVPGVHQGKRMCGFKLVCPTIIITEPSKRIARKPMSYDGFASKILQQKLANITNSDEQDQEQEEDETLQTKPVTKKLPPPPNNDDEEEDDSPKPQKAVKKTPPKQQEEQEEPEDVEEDVMAEDEVEEEEQAPPPKKVPVAKPAAKTANKKPAVTQPVQEEEEEDDEPVVPISEQPKPAPKKVIVKPKK